MFVRPKWVSMVKMSCSIALTFMQLTTSDVNINAPKIMHISADEKLHQIYSIDVDTDNYLYPFFNNLFRLLASCFLLLGCVNIPNTIGRFSMTQLGVGTRTL